MTASHLPTVLAIGDVTRAEGSAATTPFSFTVSLSAPSGLATTVSYATANGTAAAGSDFTAKAGTVTIPAGATTATVKVSVNGDTQVEPNETFTVKLSAPYNATIADAKGLATIVDDD